ncbi:hypothetical protein ACFVVA_19895 [Kitasatospora sp. NPDC058048]|uniref:hypothetical protein n=1 Tax=Kitasatospora sp. NPDC058048 TaxID=3346313 RepID=UPI0036DD6778
MFATPGTAPRTEGAETGLNAGVVLGGATRISEGTARAIESSVRAVAPAVTVVRVSVSEADHLWLARAYDADGANVPLPQQHEEAVARWIAVDQPQRDWQLQHDLDLATGHLTVAGAQTTAGY